MRSQSGLGSLDGQTGLREPADAALIRAIQQGLPLVERPYAAIAVALNLTEEAVIARIQDLLTQGIIKRLGVVVRHHELGYGANAMVVWDLPDDVVDRLGRRIGALPFVTLCYRRPRRLPDWPYNLFTMIHGRDRAAVLAQVEELKRDLELTAVPNSLLFSGRRFKQRGAFYRPDLARPDPAPADLAVPEPLTPPPNPMLAGLPKGDRDDLSPPLAELNPGRGGGSEPSLTSQIRPRRKPQAKPQVKIPVKAQVKSQVKSKPNPTAFPPLASLRESPA